MGAAEDFPRTRKRRNLPTSAPFEAQRGKTGSPSSRREIKS
ncbi:MAG: hypothetical protein ACTS6G_06285 [Candidatus Hodgkinia cicadicola]